jgi:uncharacterized protein
MGAIAKVPANTIPKLDRYLAKGIGHDDYSYPLVKELCDGGFFIESGVNEREAVEDILHQEQESRVGIMLLVHEDCNFRCNYCYENHKLGRMSSDVIEGLKALVSRQAEFYKGVSINWFGGEPLLSLDIIKELSWSFMDSCQKRYIPYNSSITTNGFLLKPAVVDELLDCQVTHFQVTLDGPQPYHDERRPLQNGHGTYQQIISNLTEMKQRSGDFTVRIRINFDQLLVTEIEKWLEEEISPLLGNDPRFHLMFFAVQQWGGDNDNNVEVCDYDVADSAIRHFDTHSLEAGFSDAVVKEVLRPHGLVCYASRESMIIVGADGTIYKCSVHFSDPRNQVGHLTSNGELLLDSERWRLWVDPDGIDKSDCSNCHIFPVCQSKRCPYAAINENKPICAMSREKFENAVRLIAGGGRGD